MFISWWDRPEFAVVDLVLLAGTWLRKLVDRRARKSVTACPRLILTEEAVAVQY